MSSHAGGSDRDDPADDELDDDDDFLRELARVEDMVPPSRQPLAGRTLGRFRILSELGRGGMGIVYLAHDESLRRAVALKLLPPSLTRQDERYRRFLREARAAASVTHPNLATIYDVGEVEGNVFIAMERVDGRTLRRALAGARPTIEHAVDIATQILAGLAKAHQAGIVHRDLKPDNIMVTDEGVVKLLDFGLAKQRGRAEPAASGASEAAQATGSAPLASGSAQREALEASAIEDRALDTAPRDTAADQLIGTPGYMSPEQVRGGAIDSRSDIFSFGVIFYEMLAGRRPFVGQSPADLQSAILRDTPPPLRSLRDDVPEPLEALIERCLEKEPARRFPSSGALSIALSQLDLATVNRFTTPSSATHRASATHRSSSPPPDAASSGSSAAAASAFSQPVAALRRLGTQGSAVAKVAAAVLITLFAGYQLRGGEDGERTGLARSEVRGEVVGSAGEDVSQARLSAAEPSAPSRPMSVTDLPLPTSKSPEAIAAYAAAMQGIRDGNWGYVASHLERAVELDPGLAVAHLRLAIIEHDSPLMRWRSYFARALAGRGSMNERDQLLLNAYEPLFSRDPPDYGEHVARLRAATERFPNDAELFGMLAWSAFREPDQMLAAATRAVELDPQYADGWQGVGASLAQLGRTEEALRALDRCVALSPATADCSAQRGFLHGSEGRCAEMDADFRRAVAVSTSGVWQHGRAAALFALGVPPEAIVEVFRNKWAQLPQDERSVLELLDRSNLDVAVGNFKDAERQTIAARKLVEADPEAQTHAMLAGQLIEIYKETNRQRDAARVADDYLKRKDVWIRSAESERQPMSMYWAMFRAKAMSRETFLQKRDAWLAHHRSDVAQRGVLSSYAAGVETADEAREALELFPPLTQPVLWEKDVASAMLGKLYVLAGKPREAVPYLQKTVKSCYALLSPLVHTRATFHLGQALEASGDTPGACSAYGNVLGRWGNAKPLSVTANKARQRARDLQCRSSAPASRDG